MSALTSSPFSPSNFSLRSHPLDVPFPVSRRFLRILCSRFLTLVPFGPNTGVSGFTPSYSLTADKFGSVSPFRRQAKRKEVSATVRAVGTFRIFLVPGKRFLEDLCLGKINVRAASAASLSIPAPGALPTAQDLWDRSAVTIRCFHVPSRRIASQPQLTSL